MFGLDISPLLGGKKLPSTGTQMTHLAQVDTYGKGDMLCCDCFHTDYTDSAPQPCYVRMAVTTTTQEQLTKTQHLMTRGFIMTYYYYINSFDNENKNN